MYTKYRAKDIHTGEWLYGEFSDYRDYVEIWVGQHGKIYEIREIANDTE